MQINIRVHDAEWSVVPPCRSRYTRHFQAYTSDILAQRCGGLWTEGRQPSSGSAAAYNTPHKIFRLCLVLYNSPVRYIMNFTWDQSTPNIPILGSDEINLNPYKVAAEDDLQYTTFIKDRAKRQDQAYVNSVFRFFSQVHYGLLTWVMSGCASVAKWTAFAPVISKRLDLYAQAHHARGQKLVSENIRMICSDLPKPSDVVIEVMDFAPGRMELTRPKFGEVSKCKLGHEISIDM